MKFQKTKNLNSRKCYYVGACEVSDKDPLTTVSPDTLTTTWAQNRNFDKVITSKPDGISKRVERRFVHLGEVNTQTKIISIRNYNRRSTVTLQNSGPHKFINFSFMVKFETEHFHIFTNNN